MINNYMIRVLYNVENKTALWGQGWVYEAGRLSPVMGPASQTKAHGRWLLPALSGRRNERPLVGLRKAQMSALLPIWTDLPKASNCTM